MAQFYSLEEAARVLGMSPDELKGKAQHREVRAFLDGGTWRFRVADVDELARRRGLGSDAELHLSDLEIPTAESDEDFDLSAFARARPSPTSASRRKSSCPRPVDTARTTTSCWTTFRCPQILSAAPVRSSSGWAPRRRAAERFRRSPRPRQPQRGERFRRPPRARPWAPRRRAILMSP